MINYDAPLNAMTCAALQHALHSRIRLLIAPRRQVRAPQRPDCARGARGHLHQVSESAAGMRVVQRVAAAAPARILDVGHAAGSIVTHDELARFKNMLRGADNNFVRQW